MTGIGLTKGIRFTNLQAFVAQRFGDGAWEGLLATLPPGDAGVLRTVVGSGWYDHALRARLVRAICLRGGAGLGRDIGRFEAERDLTTVHRWFIRLVKPAAALRDMNVYWRRTEDSGRWTSEVHGRGLVARLHDWNPVEPALCATVQGYLGRTLELLGGGELGVEHSRCRAGGDPFCEFRTDSLDVPVCARSSNEPLAAEDLAGIALELANLHDPEAVADAIVGVLHGRLSFSHVALSVCTEHDRDPRLVSVAGRRGDGIARCFVLQTCGSTVGRLDVEAPRGHVEAEVLDQLLLHFAIALRAAGGRRDPDGARAAEGAAARTAEQRARRVRAATQTWGLTPREGEVLDLVVQGMTNKEIASRIGCQEGTAEVHVSKTLKKSGAGNRAGLAALLWASD
jgi:DNA-binding CsgD family transcriptional regulator